MKIHYLLLAFCLGQLNAMSQTLNKVVSIEIKETGGANGACVVWHPIQKKYYAAMAGNKGFPMVVTDATGKILSETDTKTGADMRGMWYNPKTKNIYGNTYNMMGIVQLKINKTGLMGGSPETVSEFDQPDEQSFAVLDPIADAIMVLDDGVIKVQKKGKTDFEDLVQLKFEGFDDRDSFSDKYVNYSFAYTSQKDFVVVNMESHQLEFYDKKSGEKKLTVSIPDEVDLYEQFNFCYTNNLFFFFNKDSRIWTGYKLLNNAKAPKKKKQM